MPGRAARRGDALVAELLDRVREAFADRVVVVDDQDRRPWPSRHRPVPAGQDRSTKRRLAVGADATLDRPP